MNRAIRILPLIVLSCALSRDAKSRDAAIQAGKTVDVHILDSALPHSAFENWFRDVSGSREIRWTVSDCGEQTGSPADAGQDFPMCAEASTVAGSAEVVVAIAVGTFETGVHGDPALFYAVVTRDKKMFDTIKLSELPNLIREHR